MKAVDTHGFRDNTLLVFTNDNGPVLEAMSKPWRGTKNTTFEGGVRVPCLVRWPGRVKPQVREELVSTIDLTPTLLAAANAAPISDLPGRALQPLFEGSELVLVGLVKRCYRHLTLGQLVLERSFARG